MRWARRQPALASGYAAGGRFDEAALMTPLLIAVVACGLHTCAGLLGTIPAMWATLAFAV